MKIIVVKDYDEVSAVMANHVVELVRSKPDLRFCLPAGRSPIGMYKKLVEMFKNNEVDFSGLVTFNMDEYVGLPTDNEHSYAYFANKNFLEHINIKSENIFRPNATSNDIDEECVSYSEKIIAYGGLDLAISGVGTTGHIAFNEPNDYLKPRTHAVDLDEGTIKQNSVLFDDINEVPRQAITIGMEEIMKSKNFFVVASGIEKAPMLARLFKNDHLDTHYPISFLRMHNNVTFIIDEDAAKDIPKEVLRYYA